ncbi:MAG: ATP-dependent Clp protease adapter ClpS [Verrucomicrobiae bacterium]|nr:ATP-dependent Clp protease adapter ClpS [Verrucomicrobiae bacterium]MCP5541082.1 ATP-dependent Clp protease adapter ClpS [Akkermansiaceae bacterium]
MPFTPDSDGDTAILTEEQTSADLDSPWHVVVFNDPVNLMSFVTLVFRRIFGYSEEKATKLMLEVHQLGQSTVWTGEREKAEFYVQQLQSHQLYAAMKKAA